jgi:hypothetical protein
LQLHSSRTCGAALTPSAYDTDSPEYAAI